MTQRPRFRFLLWSPGFTLAMFCALTMIAPNPAQAQTFQVIHSFNGGEGGYYPYAVVTDRAGNLYGTAAFGGTYTSNCNSDGTQTGCGVIYKMSHHGSGWIFNVLSSFDGPNGYNPEQQITLAPDGSLYGTTIWGGPGDCHDFAPGCGTVFQMRPPATFCSSVSCAWTVTDIHQFLNGTNDGAFPQIGSLTLDAAGNIYGTTEVGGLYGAGVVYEQSPTANGWTMSVLYNFRQFPDGTDPWGGVVFDNAGNLYGVTSAGGASNYGAAYQLTRTDSGWTEHIIHSFYDTTDGATPSGNLVMDASGNLYGVTEYDGPKNGGTIWELSPANGGWNFTVLYSFDGHSGSGPLGGLIMDQAGNLYGASFNNGAYKWGSVFKLSRNAGGWGYTSLYDFTGGADGGLPFSPLTMDSAGNLFGVTEIGGSSQNCGTDRCGVVWEITP